MALSALSAGILISCVKPADDNKAAEVDSQVAQDSAELKTGENAAVDGNTDKNVELWHRRLGHCSLDEIRKLIKHDLVEGLPKISSRTEGICEPCAKGKHAKSSFKSKTVVTTSKPLELLHMDLFGPIRTASLGGKIHGYVIVDDYSRYT